MSTIKITDEMRRAGRLEALIAIIERDYTVAGGPVPDDVNEIKDRHGDAWLRLADGRWVLEGDGLIMTQDGICETYGPVTW